MITKNEAIEVLNTYMLGKDTDQPNVLATMFAEDAVVTFDIKTPIIQFPDEIKGREQIARTMFGEFHLLFSDVKSYYLSDDFQDLNEDQVKNQKWLVSMKERESGNSRIGTGSYDWQFEFANGNWRVKGVHIVIEAMVSFVASEANWLENLQRQLNRYPWANTEEAARLVANEPELTSVHNYLKQG